MSKITIKDNQKSSYLYLLGVRPNKEIILDQDIVISAVNSSPAPNEMIRAVMSEQGSCSELELGILVSTLRATSAEVHVTSNSAQTLAKRTWNAQSDIMLLSALANKEIYWSIQSDTSANCFNAETVVNAVINNRLFIPENIAILDDTECDLLSEQVAKARSLIDNDNFNTAANCLWSYKFNLRPSIRLATLWTGIESLFSVQSELVFRISYLSSKFLDFDENGFRKVKKLYTARSKAVHAGISPSAEIVAETAALLHKLILKCVSSGELPSEDKLLFQTSI